MIGSFRACAMVAALASGVGAAACDGDGSSGSSGTNDRIKNAKRPETVRGLGDGAYFYIKGTAPVPFLELRVGDRIMTVGVSGNDLHPVSDDEAKRLERAAAELIVQRLKPRGES